MGCCFVSEVVEPDSSRMPQGSLGDVVVPGFVDPEVKTLCEFDRDFQKVRSEFVQRKSDRSRVLALLGFSFFTAVGVVGPPVFLDDLQFDWLGDLALRFLPITILIIVGVIFSGVYLWSYSLESVTTPPRLPDGKVVVYRSQLGSALHPQFDKLAAAAWNKPLGSVEHEQLWAFLESMGFHRTV